MNLTLITKSSNLNGIFGELHGPSGSEILMYTLEHAYPDGKGGFVPKLARGRTYTCQRGTHKLSNLIPFITFEVLDVPPFQNASVKGLLCCHIGNVNRDSEGCVLVGLTLKTNCILDSEKAFEKFLELQEGVDTYQLTVL